MASIEADFKRPLTDIYAELPQTTKDYINESSARIWFYFGLWVLFLITSATFIAFLVTHALINEPIGNRIQRVGSIIPVIAIVGEGLFIVKINRLASILHPAKLTCEIYLNRKFKNLLRATVAITFLLVLVGSILSGYGDTIFLTFEHLLKCLTLSKL